MTYEEKIIAAKEKGITLPPLEEMESTTGIYGFYAVKGKEQICFYVGKAVNIASRMFNSNNEGHIFRYLKGDTEKIVSRNIIHYRNLGYTIEVHILESVDYEDQYYTRAAHRLAFAELKHIVFYQEMGQCLEQKLEGSKASDEAFFNKNYKIKK